MIEVTLSILDYAMLTAVGFVLIAIHRLMEVCYR